MSKAYKLGEVPWWVRLKWWIKYDVLKFKRPLPKVTRSWIGGAKASEMAFGKDKYRKQEGAKLQTFEELLVNHQNPNYVPWDPKTHWRKGE